MILQGSEVEYKIAYKYAFTMYLKMMEVASPLLFEKCGWLHQHSTQEGGGGIHTSP